MIIQLFSKSLFTIIIDDTPCKLECFQPSLIHADKAEAYPSKVCPSFEKEH
jgi:hypothetical protein